MEETTPAANARAGRKVAVLTGELQDPRSAYAAANVVLGMGGSALRGMAFGKPLIVQGERGFWELVTLESTLTFLRPGWEGGGPSGARRAWRRYCARCWTILPPRLVSGNMAGGWWWKGSAWSALAPFKKRSTPP